MTSTWVQLAVGLVLMLAMVIRCELPDFPQALSGANRVLTMVVAFTLSRMDPLLHILRNQQAMCEGGWDATLVIFTARDVSPAMQRYLESRLYCHRIERNVALHISKHDPSVHINLVEEMKDYMKSVWQNYDVFVYMEEDVIVEYQHVMGYLAETRKLWALVGKEKALTQYYIGFQRYRRHLVPMDKNKGHRTDAELLEQEFLEEVPLFYPICLKDRPYMHVRGNKRTPAANVYQAMWILTREQVAALQGSCKFLDQTFRGTRQQKSGYVREYLGSLSLLENDIIGPSCGLKKLIPAGRLLDFAVWHYYYSTDPLLRHEDHPLFGTHEHINAGLLQAKEPLAFAGYAADAPCWDPLLQLGRARLNGSLPAADSVSVVSFQGETSVIKGGKRHRVHGEAGQAALRALGYDRLPVHSAKHLMFEALPQGPDLQ